MQNKIVAITILLLSGSFSSTIIQPYITIFELLLCIYIFAYIILTFASKIKRIKHTQVFTPLLLISIVIFVSMFNSVFVLHQSLFAMGNNHFESILAVLFLSIMTYHKEKLSYSSILWYLEILTCILLIIFATTQITSKNEIIIVKGALSGTVHSYNIKDMGSILFVFFGIRRFMHFVKCFEFKSFFLAFLYLGYPLVSHNSRILIIALTIVSLFGFFSAPKRVQQKGIFLGASAVGVLFVSYFLGGSKSFLQTKYGSLKSAVTLVLTGEDAGMESGTSIRLLEMEQAIVNFKNHYLLGTGSIGNSWGTLGENYFYSSDIGIAGIVLEVGAVGLVLLAISFLQVYRVIKRSATELKIFFIVLLFINVTTGYLYFELLSTSIFLVLAIIKISNDDRMGNSVLLQ